MIKNEGAVNMTLPDILSLWIPLRQPEAEKPNETSHMPLGGDPYANTYLLSRSNTAIYFGEEEKCN